MLRTRELELRLADVAALVASLPDDDAEDVTVDSFAGVKAALGHALAGSSGCIDPDEWQAQREAALERHRDELGLDQPTGDAELGHVLGAGDGRGPGVAPFDPNYPTIILDELGAVAMRLEPGGRNAVYLELGGRFNKRTNRGQCGYVLAVGQAAELLAELVVAGQAGGADFTRELEPAIARKQAARGLSRRR